MRIGIVPDTHFPAEHPGALDFILDTFDAWEVEQVVHIGDVSDLHGPSFHDKHPEMPGPEDEYEQAKQATQSWDHALRDAGFITKKRPMKVCIGNHDDRPRRVAAKYGVAQGFMASYNDSWGTAWDWGTQFLIDGALYTHGHKGCSGGRTPAFTTLLNGCDTSLVIGHYHVRGGIVPMCGHTSRRWAMSVGCLLDRLHPAMAYAEGTVLKQILSCGVVIDGHPYYEMMPCGRGELYHRSNFK